MHRAGAAVERGPERAAGELAQPAQPLRRGGVLVDLEVPLGGAAVELDLVDRLPGAEVAQLGRAVGGEHEQRHARLVRLDHRGRVVGRRGARRARERDRGPLALASPSAKKAPLRSSRCEVARIRGSRASESTSGVERDPGEVQASRRPQRASSSHERAQAEVGVGRPIAGIDAQRSRCPRRSSSSTASPRRGRAGGGRSPRSADAIARSRPTSPATGTRPRGPASFAACTGLRAGARRTSASRSRATRWAAGSRSRRARARPPASTGSCWSARARGSPTRPSARRAGRRRGARRPDRGDRRRGVRARVGGAQPLFAGQPSASRPPPTPTACATPRRASPPRCAGSAPA